MTLPLDTRKYILVSIPASNYVQKARWGLRLAKIDFTEEMHAPAFHRFSTRPKGGSSVPLLYCPETKLSLTDSDPILSFCGQHVPSLYPHEHVKALELKYDTDFGPHARRYAYGFIFAKKGSTFKHIIVDSLQGTMESYVVSCVLPMLQIMLTKAFNVTDAGVERSWAKIDHVFNEASAILGDAPLGSTYLAGPSFTAADISFCSHASLLLGPPQNPFLHPHFQPDDMPLTFRARYEHLRASKAGQFVLYCFEHHYPSSDDL
ncbi:hypothetical protein DYB25_011766 [Aphanomyces astaci]|uniref:GST N-terminal domain-containing protein n=1 Tax=Aphanomyces astaci TaxID=112090 RepID=A0A397F5R8_APHAT|nr:hypothetical protein DYB25_011766 [Aphanomyces astaci]RHY14274.1 hypothetical protein DYB36_010362 [Aphanomyces astaci]RHY59098.1 hypothetical protein DYB38_007988 [Aphanomyces astaci]RHY67255.1 hypothetical protein DYB34_009666 [Aphanomyces astaci]RHY70198.1 hypothetical protein DYB30_000956 [Aphanomyces astaci]